MKNAPYKIEQTTYLVQLSINKHLEFKDFCSLQESSMVIYKNWDKTKFCNGYLVYLARKNDLFGVNLLVEDYGRHLTPYSYNLAVFKAIENNHLNIVIFLTEKCNRDVHRCFIKACLRIASEHGNIVMVNYFAAWRFKATDINICLLQAAKFNHLALVKFLLKMYIIDLSFGNNAAIKIALEKNNAEIVLFLLKKSSHLDNTLRDLQSN